MTTFYRTGNARRSIDCWSVPVASVRTDEILMIREAAREAGREADETVATAEAVATDATVHRLASA